MKDKKYRAIPIFIVLFISLFTSTCFAGQQWIYFHDKEIKGSVVDVETGRPIEGAIVIGMWALTQIPGEGFGGYAKIQVVITDKEGNFTIPSWTTFKPWKLLSVTHGLAPKIVIYKPGYKLYWSTKIGREGFPDHYEITEEDKKKIKEKNSLTPAKLKRIYTDEEILKNYHEFSLQADFPSSYYLKKQSEVIFDALDEELSQLRDKNEFNTSRLIISNKELRKFWIGGNK